MARPEDLTLLALLAEREADGGALTRVDLFAAPIPGVRDPAESLARLALDGLVESRSSTAHGVPRLFVTDAGHWALEPHNPA